jgi:hypothetical protein
MNIQGTGLNLMTQAGADLTRLSTFRRHTLKFHFSALPQAALVLAVTLAMTGCGKSGPEFAKVSGSVKLSGKPLTAGSVSFISGDPKRNNANGNIGPDGRYELQTTNPGDGAELGEYTVIVSGIDPNALNTAAPGEPLKKMANPVPAKYEKPESSGLKFKVERGSNTFDIDLQP